MWEKVKVKHPLCLHKSVSERVMKGREIKVERDKEGRVQKDRCTKSGGRERNKIGLRDMKEERRDR